MKLFIDDYRIAPEGWEDAHTIAEAIRVIDTRSDITAISLDHDIAYVNTQTDFMATNETFEPVARFIRVKGIPVYAGMDPHVEGAVRIWIHTGNPGGGENIAKILGLDYQKCIVSNITLNRMEKYYHAEPT